MNERRGVLGKVVAVVVPEVVLFRLLLRSNQLIDDSCGEDASEVAASRKIIQKPSRWPNFEVELHQRPKLAVKPVQAFDQPALRVVDVRICFLLFPSLSNKNSANTLRTAARGQGFT